jgi:glyoxylase-like metal-dependent hydrolase (beta-lactamase superfamily II)
MNMLDRRTFVRRTGVAGLSLLAFNLSLNKAAADPDPPTTGKPPAPAQGPLSEPDVHAFRLGGMEAFIVHDGALAFPGIQPSFAPQATKEQLEEVLHRNFLPADHLAMSMNVLVVKSKSGVLLFDAGAGSSFGDVGGKLVRGLARIGVTPNDVTMIFITHAHGDHIAGLLTDGNKPVFNSARILASKAEVDFWMSHDPDLSGMTTPPEARVQLLAAIQGVLNGVKGQLELKEPGKLSPEVELIAAPGHTPGHSLFRVSQGDEQLLVIGDAVHSYALQFPHPEWTMAYDVNPGMAVSTRRKIFKDAAAARTTLMGYHLPFPGIGHARAVGSGYEWVPRPWVV